MSPALIAYSFLDEHSATLPNVDSKPGKDEHPKA